MNKIASAPRPVSQEVAQFQVYGDSRRGKSETASHTDYAALRAEETLCMYSAAIGAEGNCIHVRCGDSRRGKLSKKFAGDSLRDYLRTSAIGAVCISGKSEMLNLMYGRRQSKPFLCLGWGGGCAGLRHKYKAFKPYKKTGTDGANAWPTSNDLRDGCRLRPGRPTVRHSRWSPS
jgi:hypothetical protein